MDGLSKKGTMEPTGSPQRSQEAGGGEPVGGPPTRRVSAKRKLAAVKRLFRGEPLELLSRELNVTAARLSDWRDGVESAAETVLDSGQTPPRPHRPLRRRHLGHAYQANDRRGAVHWRRLSQDLSTATLGGHPNLTRAHPAPDGRAWSARSAPAGHKAGQAA